MMVRTIKILIFILLPLLIIGCEEILEVPDISGEEVQLLAPSDSTVVGESEVGFSWNGIQDADAYLIQVARPVFNNASQLVLDSIIVVDSTFKGTRASKVLTDSDYEWRVKAMNSGYETPFSSNTFKVSTLED